jgi:outer membrane immunogenic protein
MTLWRASLLILTLTGATALSANAADLSAPGYKDGPYVPMSWTGFYIGAHLGGAWGDMDIKDVDKLNGGAKYTLSSSDVITGGQFGYNWQRSNVVFGFESDIGWLGLNGQKFDPNFPGGTFSGLGSGFYGTLTGRLGYAFDRTLVYAKGGYALFSGQAFVDNSAGGFGGGRVFTGIWNGWTVGTGVEYLLTPLWSIKIEYQHFDFGSQDALLITPANGNFRYSNDLTADSVKAGVNLHIGQPPAPLK